jgi:hypothetical protein
MTGRVVVGGAVDRPPLVDDARAFAAAQPS